ncbi:Hpt domain-containing protein [Thermophagus sp. OGC60D27]|uniref:Hpt domain-containing protein n=1 Tax=Thermophagus sp. OGC60D27 TaxID=3458415 RepID=UPI004037710E
MHKQYECINLSYLDSIAEGDRSIITELITIFLDQIPEFTKGFDQAFSEKRWLDVAALAHKAKSSVLSLGMEELGNRDLKNLELVAKELFVRDIENKSNPTTKEVETANQLKKNLQEYEEERQLWVKSHATTDTVAVIINTFKDVLIKAEEELKLEIGK